MRKIPKSGLKPQPLAYTDNDLSIKISHAKNTQAWTQTRTFGLHWQWSTDCGFSCEKCSSLDSNQNLCLTLTMIYRLSFLMRKQLKPRLKLEPLAYTDNDLPIELFNAKNAQAWTPTRIFRLHLQWSTIWAFACEKCPSQDTNQNLWLILTMFYRYPIKYSFSKDFSKSWHMLLAANMNNPHL